MKKIEIAITAVNFVFAAVTFGFMAYLAANKGILDGKDWLAVGYFTVTFSAASFFVWRRYDRWRLDKIETDN